MTWTTYIMFMLGLTVLTGSIFTGFWYLATHILERKGNARRIYQLLKFTMTGYLIPVFFLILLVYPRLTKHIHGYLFVTSPFIRVVLMVLFVVWLLGFGACCLIYIPRFLNFRSVCRSCIPAPIAVQKVAERLCRELKVRNRVKIKQSYIVAVPFITGIFRPCIYLPMREYPESQLEMVLTHELVHYKYHDAVWKPIFVAATCIFWFNPLVWLVSKQFQKWAEANCDLYCCKNKYEFKEYFNGILLMVSDAFLQIGTFAPTWQEGKSELYWRVENMAINLKQKPNRLVTTIVTIGTVLLSTVATFATEEGIRKVYGYVYEETAIKIEEEPQVIVDDYEELIGDISDFDGMEIIVHDGEPIGRALPINDTIQNGQVHQYGPIAKNSGDTIYVSVSIEPTDKYVEVGIIEPDGKTRCVKTWDNFVHTFTLTKTGNYQVFISNKSGSTVTVYGYYK